MTARKQTSRGPTQLTLTAYQVGFGDCFLLSWKYPRGDKHVLIDFGSNGSPKASPANLLKTIADDIAKTCGGKLHAVVVTHRHKDHMSGFTTSADGRGTGDTIRSLKPDVVVQPWTENPTASPNPSVGKRASALQSSGQRVSPGLFAQSLSAMQDVSAGIAVEAARLAAGEQLKRRLPLFKRLQFAGEEGIKNPSAVKNLQTMAKRHAYVNHGGKSGLESTLPGVRITVLGPPTLLQSEAIRKERQKDQAEFWMLSANAGLHTVATSKPIFPRARIIAGVTPPPYARWFVPRVRDMRAQGMQQIVRVLDNAMNNTSVILLFEVGNKSFLFPGDAQIENWEFTLKNPALMKRLKGVTFYKVGHHGSRNATPKTLWNGFENRGAASRRTRLQTVVSTMADKFGTTEGAEVPRKTLIDALRKDSDFFTTQTLKGKVMKKTFVFEW